MSPWGNIGIRDLEPELRISPRPVIIALVVPAAVLAFLAPRLPDPTAASAMAILLYMLAGLLWAVTGWNDRLGRWATVLALIAAIQLARYLLEIPGLFALLALTTALSTAMIGLSSTFAVAAIESLLLLVPLLRPADVVPGSEIGIALLLVWGTAAIMQGTYPPIGDLVRWSWERFEHSRALLEEVRNRQVQLKEALDALAHANRELALANERLAAMRLIAEEARKSKAAFVANVSHELRTPLNIIIGLADVLLRTPEVEGQRMPASVQEDLAILYRNCEHLSGMINDVLDLSQVEAGRLALRREWVDLSALIDSALRIVRPLLEKKGLSLEIAIPADLPSVYCDPRRIRQVVLNLLGNAARHTEEGGIGIRASVEGRYLRVDVTDTGPGIAAEEAERIFEPFQQGTTGPWASRNGSGLGLSISKQFVELHDGQMGLESQLGIGSTFHFRLPIAPLAGPTASPARWITEDWVPRTARVELPVPRLEQRVILCDPLGEAYPLLARYGDQMEFVDTRTPAEALQALEQNPAQAIWITAPTPGALWELTEAIHAGKPDMPVIGICLPPRMTSDLLVGASGFLLKPVLCRQLEEAIIRLGRTPQRVLIADDDLDTLHVLTQMLRTRDETLEIVTATDGQQALEAMRHWHPDLVLLDIAMPRMDGWQVLAASSQDESIRDIPVLVISATDLNEQPATSRLILGTMGEGLSLNKILRCGRTLASFLLQPDSSSPDPGPG